MIAEQDFSYMEDLERRRCEELQGEMLRFLATREWEDTDALWAAAASSLGNEDERYCQIYICLECGGVYHDDYSTNSDPERDFCGGECEVSWFESNPEADYRGELMCEGKSRGMNLCTTL